MIKETLGEGDSTRVTMLVKSFFVLIIMAWLAGLWYFPLAAVFFPIFFIPSLFYFWWWYVNRSIARLHTVVRLYSFGMLFAGGACWLTESILLSFFRHIYVALTPDRCRLCDIVYLIIIAGMFISLEEFIKYMLGIYGRGWSTDLKKTKANLIYFTGAGLGFATAQGFLYTFLNSEAIEHSFNQSDLTLWEQLVVVLMVTFLFTPQHALTGYIIGLSIIRRDVLQMMEDDVDLAEQGYGRGAEREEREDATITFSEEKTSINNRPLHMTNVPSQSSTYKDDDRNDRKETEPQSMPDDIKDAAGERKTGTGDFDYQDDSICESVVDIKIEMKVSVNGSGSGNGNQREHRHEKGIVESERKRKNSSEPTEQKGQLKRERILSSSPSARSDKTSDGRRKQSCSGERKRARHKTTPGAKGVSFHLKNKRDGPTSPHASPENRHKHESKSHGKRKSNLLSPEVMSQRQALRFQHELHEYANMSWLGQNKEDDGLNGTVNRSCRDIFSVESLKLLAIPVAFRTLVLSQAGIMIILFGNYLAFVSLTLTTIFLCCCFVCYIKSYEMSFPSQYLREVGYLHIPVVDCRLNPAHTEAVQATGQE